MTSEATDLIVIDALGPDGTYRTRSREPVTTTDGVAVAELTLAPPLYVSRAIGAQRGVRPLPAHEREAALAKAADTFAHGVIAGLDFDAYTDLASRISGRADLGDPRRGARRRRRCRIGFRRGAAGTAVGRGARLARRTMPGGVARSGPGGATCSLSSPPATARACMACGRKRWPWDIGSLFDRHAANRSPPTA